MRMIPAEFENQTLIKSNHPLPHLKRMNYYYNLVPHSSGTIKQQTLIQIVQIRQKYPTLID